MHSVGRPNVAVFDSDGRLAEFASIDDYTMLSYKPTYLSFTTRGASIRPSCELGRSPSAQQIDGRTSAVFVSHGSLAELDSIEDTSSTDGSSTDEEVEAMLKNKACLIRLVSTSDNRDHSVLCLVVK